MDLFNLPTKGDQEAFLKKVAKFREDRLKEERAHEDRVRVFRIREDL